jgi:uncharacterized membrane protein YvlD (DUF360 family)
VTARPNSGAPVRHRDVAKCHHEPTNQLIEGADMQVRLIRIGLVLAGNALGLWIASLVLSDDMSVSGAAFIIAVVIFSALTLILEPIVSRLTDKYAEALTGGRALISTALALVLTAWISDGLSIDGFGTWLLATVIVWLVTAIVGVVLARLFLKNAVEK